MVDAAEDDAARSAAIHHLLRVGQLVDSPDAEAPCSIPRVVVQFWHDLASLPNDVAGCMRSWDALAHLGFVRKVFDDSAAREFIANHFSGDHVQAYDRCPHPAMRCDLFRLCYLVARGGFYVDADEDYQGVDCSFLFRNDRLKVAALCYDRDSDDMVPAATFAGTGERSPSWTYYVNNNPLVAPQGHPVLKRALARAVSRLNRGEGPKDVQGTTGPGNLTASLVAHVMSNAQRVDKQDFSLLVNWDAVSVSRWPLSYRSDERNWRVWEHAQT